MGNILFGINAKKLDMGTLNFACYLAKLSHSGISGVFLENLATFEKPVVRKMYDGTYIDLEIDEDADAYQQETNLVEQNIEKFKEECARLGINYAVHRDKYRPLSATIKETRFADMLILDPGTTLKEHAGNNPTGFVKKVLTKSECPVIIAPNKFDGIEELLVAYDGSRSALFAIKQFTYLFPEYRGKKITILQVNEHNEPDTGDKEKIGKFLGMHYTDITFQHLKGDAVDMLFRTLQKKKKTFVIMGAFGQSTIASLFRHSTAEPIVEYIDLPVFIAHP